MANDQEGRNGKRLETYSDLATDQIADQILELIVRQSQEIISHWPRLSAHIPGSQAVERQIAAGLSLTNEKINRAVRACTPSRNVFV